MSDNVVDKEKNYWLEKLAGEPEKSIFPYDTIITPNKNDEKEKLEINFPQELCNKLDRVTNKSDKNLFVFLTAALTFLLGKYSTNDDIILIVPIYKQQIDGQFINTLLNVRNRLDYEKSFRDLIIQVKNTLSEANRHPNYPLDRLMYHLGIKTTGSDVYPLSEIAVILENIHKRQYLDSIKLSLISSFTSALGRIDANVEFNPGLYRKKNH